ncbi:MAG TPA: RNA polymerase sigma-70 factor [Pedobacter sp.]
MAEYGTYTDEQLTLLLKTGNKAAFTEIYNRYWPLLFLHVRRMLSDDELAQDVVQELFTRIWNKAEGLEFTTSLSAYLYSSVRNRVFNVIKHEKIKESSLLDIAKFMEEGTLLADERLRYQELVNVIEAEITKMPEKMREIFELSRKDNLSHKEIAARLGISEHTVRKQVQRALKNLRHKLDLPASVVLVILYANR